MIIDCDTCEARGLACDDCVVSVMLGMPRIGEAGAGIEVDADEARAIAVLVESGLVPPLRLLPGERSSRPESTPTLGTRPPHGPWPAASGAL